MRGTYRRPPQHRRPAYDRLSAAFRQECLASIRVACSRARVKDRAKGRTRLADLHEELARMPRTPRMNVLLLGALLRAAGVCVEQIGGFVWVMHDPYLDAFIEQRPLSRHRWPRTPVR